MCAWESWQALGDDVVPLVMIISAVWSSSFSGSGGLGWWEPCERRSPIHIQSLKGLDPLASRNLCGIFTVSSEAEFWIWAAAGASMTTNASGWTIFRIRWVSIVVLIIRGLTGRNTASSLTAVQKSRAHSIRLSTKATTVIFLPMPSLESAAAKFSTSLNSLAYDHTKGPPARVLSSSHKKGLSWCKEVTAGLPPKRRVTSAKDGHSLGSGSWRHVPWISASLLGVSALSAILLRVEGLREERKEKNGFHNLR